MRATFFPDWGVDHAHMVPICHQIQCAKIAHSDTTRRSTPPPPAASVLAAPLETAAADAPAAHLGNTMISKMFLHLAKMDFIDQDLSPSLRKCSWRTVSRVLQEHFRLTQRARHAWRTKSTCPTAGPPRACGAHLRRAAADRAAATSTALASHAQLQTHRSCRHASASFTFRPSCSRVSRAASALLKPTRFQCATDRLHQTSPSASA